jgi:hypothetical protein
MSGAWWLLVGLIPFVVLLGLLWLLSQGTQGRSGGDY